MPDYDIRDSRGVKIGSLTEARDSDHVPLRSVDHLWREKENRDRQRRKRVKVATLVLLLPAVFLGYRLLYEVIMRLGANSEKDGSILPWIVALIVLGTALISAAIYSE